jgi:uncharacterized repeat protein (TIGR03803 family)
MKTLLKNFGLVCVIAFGAIFSEVAVKAQTFTTLKQFGILTNMTGFGPYSQLVQGPDGALYGTTSDSEVGHGTVFKVQPDGSGFRVLKWLTNSLAEGFPYAGLIVRGRTLYGTASGFSEYAPGGTVFSINIDGSDYKILKHFADSNEVDGLFPMARLTLSGDTLYGTTLGGGAFERGTLFKLKSDGTGFTILKQFSTAYWNNTLRTITNSDGVQPSTAVVVSHKALYGTTSYGGPGGRGTVFKMNTDGSDYTVLRQFSLGDGAPVSELTLSRNILYGTTSDWNANYGMVYKLGTDGSDYTVLKRFTLQDGHYPQGGLSLFNDQLYGTTYNGGSSNYGTIFRINTDGSGYIILKDFSGDDGALPHASMSLIGGILYGATTGGGPSHGGTLFKLNTDGSDFTPFKYFTYSDGISPSSLILSSGTLFGTTFRGGNRNLGTVFRIGSNGTDYKILKHFSGSDGQNPNGELTLYGSALYGITISGDSDYGTVYKVNTDGSGFSTLKQFISRTSPDGYDPVGGVAVADNMIYGATAAGGDSDGSYSGTAFRMKVDGSGYTVLKRFSQTAWDPDNLSYTNADGAGPVGDLLLSNNVLYGITDGGGALGGGTIFKLNTDGSGFTSLKQFSQTLYSDSQIFTNSDGTRLNRGLALAGNVLYGTASARGMEGYGTAFKLNTDGTGFAVLRHFTRDDWLPVTPLTEANDVLYGATSDGSHGTVFQMNADGGAYSVLKVFVGYPDGDYTSTRPIISGNTLYGTTAGGGQWTYGTIYKIDLSGPLLPIPLNVQRLSQSVILNWRHAGFSLQAAPEPRGAYTNVPGATSPYTNPLSGPTKFFRLIGH